MTAQVQSRRQIGGAPDKRRKKVVAFALAGVVATAGIAGAVVTSSAFFTDVKEIGNNTITLQGVDIDAYTSGGNSILTSFDLSELAPVDATNATAWGAAPTRAFDVRNISNSPFKYKVEIVGITLYEKDGTTLLGGSDTSTALAAGKVADVVKVNAVRALAGATPTYTPADSKTLTALATTPTILDDTAAAATLQKKDDTNGVTTDEAVVGVRFWIDQAALAADTNYWTAAKQNLLQNVKIAYKIKISAIQLNS